MTTIAPQAALAPTGDRLGTMPRQFVRFAVIGVANTGLSLVFYVLFRMVVTATVANLVATLLTTVIGTVVNGKVTFGVRGMVTVGQHAKSMAVTALGIVITTVAVNIVGGSTGELVALTVASGVAGGLRFLLLRHWVFEPQRT
ncbi:GtrA family protein [Kibdelosporangium aridum]|uniref:GtrA family protein n=1 Tax=Kibdelosporangium aridum TaxID=2030 RepID=UPI00052573FC